MLRQSKFLIYIVLGTFLGLGLFFFANLMLQLLKATGDDLLEGGRLKFSYTQTKNNEKEVKPLKRQKGPRIWVKLTKNWGSEPAVSKRNEFPGYNDPIPRAGLIRGRRSKSQTSVGSALAIYPNGVWLTAKHVVENCKNIIVQAGIKNGKPANLVPTKVITHPKADVAVITSPRTDHGRRPFNLVARGDNSGDAFHIGFPSGKPGAVHSRYLGRMKVRRGRTNKSVEDLLVWAEITRIPNFSGSLGGISGGAVVDRTGALIGINSAASVRRGRILTSRPRTLMDIIRLSGHISPTASQNRSMVLELNKKKYPSFAKAAIQDRRVVRVICRRRL